MSTPIKPAGVELNTGHKASLESLPLTIDQPKEPIPEKLIPTVDEPRQAKDLLATQLSPEAKAPNLDGKYEQVEELGTGGTAKVIKARSTDTGNVVAIKIFNDWLQPKQSTRSFREIRLLQELQHPHIVEIVEWGSFDRRLAIVMPFAEGNLAKEIKTIEPKALVKATLDILDGLDYLHARDITHRDLKPENILRVNGVVQIADFGIAKKRSGTFIETDLTSGGFVGTPEFVAPEEARYFLEPLTYPNPSEQIYADQFDIYGVGAMLFLGLTREFPIDLPQRSKGDFDIIPGTRIIATKPPKSLRKLNPKIHEELAGLVMAILEKDPAKRKQTFTDRKHPEFTSPKVLSHRLSSLLTRDLITC